MSMGPVGLKAQTTEYSLRSSVDLELKIAKKLKVEITPEYRYNPENRAGTLLVQTGLNYRMAGWLSVGGYYRLDVSKATGSENLDGSAYDFSNRFAFDANAKVSLKRFTPKFRVRYCNFTDFDNDTEDKSNYLRYRIRLDYNVKGIKLTPFAAAEFYQKLSSGLFSKARYYIGAEYQFNKGNAISFEYSFADKFKNLTRYHILEAVYKINL